MFYVKGKEKVTLSYTASIIGASHTSGVVSSYGPAGVDKKQKEVDKNTIREGQSGIRIM